MLKKSKTCAWKKNRTITWWRLTGKILDVQSMETREFIFIQKLVLHVFETLVNPQYARQKFFNKQDDDRFLTKIVQEAICACLVKQGTDMCETFLEHFPDPVISSDDFKHQISLMKDVYLQTVTTLSDMVRFCTLVAVFSCLAFCREARSAPFVAMQLLYEIMMDFVSEGKQSNHVWTQLNDKNWLCPFEEQLETYHILYDGTEVS